MSQIDIGTIRTGYDFSANPALTSPGFAYSGNQYCFVLAGALPAPIHGSEGDQKLHAFKSTDAGATWAEQDSGGAPVIDHPLGVGPATNPGYCICQDGATVYIIYVRNHISSGTPTMDGFAVILYDLGTDTWGSPTDYTAPVIDWFSTPHTMLCLVLRAPGDMVFYYTGPQETGKARVYYATFDGSTFGTGTELPDQTGDPSFSYPVGAAVDVSGFTHFFYSQFSSPFNVWHISMDGSGTFGTRELVTDRGFLSNSVGTFSAPIVFSTGGHEYIALAGMCEGTGHEEFRMLYAQTAGIGVATWHTTLIGSGDYGDLTVIPPTIPWMETATYQGVMASVAFLSGKLTVTWTWSNSGFGGNDNGTFYWQSQTFPAGSWSTPTAVIDSSLSVMAAQAAQVATWPIGSNIGVLAASVTQESIEVLQFNSFSPGGVSPSTGNKTRTYYQ